MIDREQIAAISDPAARGVIEKLIETVTRLEAEVAVLVAPHRRVFDANRDRAMSLRCPTHGRQPESVDFKPQAGKLFVSHVSGCCQPFIQRVLAVLQGQQDPEPGAPT